MFPCKNCNDDKCCFSSGAAKYLGVDAGVFPAFECLFNGVKKRVAPVWNLVAPKAIGLWNLLKNKLIKKPEAAPWFYALFGSLIAVLCMKGIGAFIVTSVLLGVYSLFVLFAGSLIQIHTHFHRETDGVFDYFVKVIAVFVAVLWLFCFGFLFTLFTAAMLWAFHRFLKKNGWIVNAPETPVVYEIPKKPKDKIYIRRDGSRFRTASEALAVPKAEEPKEAPQDKLDATDILLALWVNSQAR